MEQFAKKVNDYFGKCSVSDVWQSSEYASEIFDLVKDSVDKEDYLYFRTNGPKLQTTPHICAFCMFRKLYKYIFWNFAKIVLVIIL